MARPFRLRRRCLAIVAGVLLSSSPVFAQRDLTDIPPPDPEVERQSFEVAEGFEVRLYAADPLIAKPIQMNFDPQGRLWVVSSEVYPHIEPGQTANDKVLILEDTTGDGAADKTTVFADGLLIPTGIEPGDGGAYVANSTELLHLADTTGDGRADRRRIVLSGFGTEDTHHIIHTFRWGPEGLLYFNQSIYIHSHVETPWGVRRLGGGGIWQFRPEKMRLEVFARGWVNTWGHHFDDYGQSFVTDGAGGEGINFAVPGAAYPTAVGVPRILHGLNPGSPKHCGLEIVSGRHLPDDWQGNLITNDFRGHRVCRFVVTEDGSGFASQPMPDLLRSSHVAFRPVDVKMGPDGAIYVADWYNPIIQHGEVDFRDPRRDKVHGRIWRITHKERPLVERPALVDAPVDELLEHLKAPEGWTRHQAKRVLKERWFDAQRRLDAQRRARLAERGTRNPADGRRDGAKEADHDLVEIRVKLTAWPGDLDPDDPLVERHRLEVLWLHQQIDVVQPELLEQLLRAADHRVRGAATRVLGHWADRLDGPLELLARQVGDEHPRVRLEAVRALGAMRDPRAVEIAMRALDHPVDHFLDYALWLTARELEPLWLPRVERGEPAFGGNADHLAFALQAVGSPDVVPPLVRLLESGQVARESEGNLLAVIAALGGPDDLRLVFDLALAGADEAPDTAAALLEALAEAARRRQVRPSAELDGIAALFDAAHERLRSAAVRCAGLWKLEAQRPVLAALAGDSDASRAVRRAALEGLADLGGAESARILERAARPATGSDDLGGDVALRASAIAALVRLDVERAAGAMGEFLGGLDDRRGASADPSPLFTAFLQQKGGPEALAAALADRTLPEDAAKLGLRAVSASGRALPELAAALTTAAGITSRLRRLPDDEMGALIADVREHGDPVAGEEVFRRGELACFKCHALGGAGGRLGPDLASIGSASQLDYLIESLLLPDEAVKEGYHTVVVLTDDGLTHTGIKLRTTDQDLILRDAEDREIAIPLDAIEEEVPGSSMMPEGLMDPLTRRELVDLVRFLSELGKPGAWTVPNEPVVRRWRVLDAAPETVQHLRRVGDAAAAGDHPALVWSAAYSTVDGTLPLEELPGLGLDRGVGEVRRTAFVRFELDVAAGGRSLLRLNSPEGLRLWIDGAPVEPAEEVPFDAVPGRRRVTLAVDLDEREFGLRIAVGEAADSEARVQVVSGK